MEKITGKTSTGFNYSFDKRILTDWNFVSMLGELTDMDKKESEKISCMQKIFFEILGKEQTDDLINHVRKNNDGFAPIEEVMKELGEITSQKN